MDYTFVVNGNKSPRKRRSAQSACETCKRRKKRCIHGLESETIADTAEEHNEQSPVPKISRVSASSPTINAVQDETGAPPTQRTRPSNPPFVFRFIGDLNPEATLVAEEGSGSGSRDRHGVGMWLGDSGQRHTAAILDKHQHHDEASNIASRKSGEERDVLLPDKSDLLALVNIYFSRINILLPILEEQAFREELQEDKASAVVLQAVCLVASKDSAAEPHLRLPSCTTSLSLSRFASRLYSNLQQDIHARNEKDRIKLIQTLSLLSLHVEGSDGAEESSLHLSQAIHHAQTIGLHLGRAASHQKSQTRLFWCLWCLSKLNAALNGRPRLLFDNDIGLRIEEAYDLFDPAAKVLLKISEMLGRVIGIYQPVAGPEITGLEDRFESFEGVVQGCGAWNLEASVLASLEIYYHGISIISHRSKNSNEDITTTPPPSRLRQELSTLQIITALQHNPIQSLVPLPMIHYSVSLAMSSLYRQLRRTKFAAKRNVIREQLEVCVSALEELGQRLSAAARMAAIGRKALRQTAHPGTAHTASGPSSLPRERARVAGVSGPETSLQTPAVREPDSDILDPAVQRAGFTEQRGVGDGGGGELDMGYSGFMDGGTFQDIDTVFGDFLDLNLPDFGMSFWHGGGEDVYRGD